MVAVSDHCVCQVTEVVIHPRYVEASSSGFDIAVYKVGPVIAHNNLPSNDISN